MNGFEEFVRLIREALNSGDVLALKALLRTVQDSSDAQLREFLAEVLRPYRMSVNIHRDGELLACATLEPDGSPFYVDDIFAGWYEITSAQGQLLWDEHLGEEKLLWSKAFPQQALELAASSDDAKEILSVSCVVKQTALQVGIAPGLTSGRMLLRNLRLKQ